MHEVTQTLVWPRLFVDWGDTPRVGRQVRPEFSLVCPGYPSRPEIQVLIDRDLDHEEAHWQPRPQEQEPGLWSFHSAFRMTSGGLDCRPGQYLIDVHVSFRDVPPQMPRFYLARIRLNVPDQQSGADSVLEIDGDGQALVNLQGCDLKQFSKVVLKGRGAGVINLLQMPDENASPGAERRTADKPATTFEYQLRIDAEKQSRLPTVYPAKQGRAYLDAAGLYFADGRRTLLLTRSRLTFGRNRGNDIVLRFMPPGPENDAFSRAISRTHFRVELNPEGIEFFDQSRSGLEVNYSVVRDRELVPARYAGDVTHVDVGVTGTVDKQFRLEMLMLAPDHRESLEELKFWDELYCELVGGGLGRTWRDSLDTRLDAVRFDRVENMPEESYVLLLREALIGGSRSQSAIVLNQGGAKNQARLLHIDRSFWLEPLPAGSLIYVDGDPCPPRSLIPLSPGTEIRFGTETATFDRFTQSYLE